MFARSGLWLGAGDEGLLRVHFLSIPAVHHGGGAVGLKKEGKEGKGEPANGRICNVILLPPHICCCRCGAAIMG